MKKDNEHWIQYAVQIQSQIAKMFEDESDNHINQEDFKDEQKLKDFFHALANVVPTQIFNKITGEDKSFLTFNHVANQLCFEYMKKEK